MKKQERVIPKKNYLYLTIMLLSVVFCTFFVVEMSDEIQNKKLEISNFNEFISEVKLEEVDSVLTEPSSDLFIIVTKVNDEDVYKLEGNIKKLIKNLDMRDNFIYIDNTNGNLDNLNKNLESNIKKIPALVYYKNGEYIKTIDSSEDLLTVGDIEQVIEEYEVD